MGYGLHEHDRRLWVHVGKVEPEPFVRVGNECMI